MSHLYSDNGLNFVGAARLLAEGWAVAISENEELWAEELANEGVESHFNPPSAPHHSRPLCPLSEDPNDDDVLTPGHFLVGTSLMSTPEPNLLLIKENQMGEGSTIASTAMEIVVERLSVEFAATGKIATEDAQP